MCFILEFWRVDDDTSEVASCLCDRFVGVSLLGSKPVFFFWNLARRDAPKSHGGSLEILCHDNMTQDSKIPWSSWLFCGDFQFSI